MTNAQQWLDKEFPNKAEREEVGEIHIKEQLIGDLDLSDLIVFTFRFISTLNLTIINIVLMNQKIKLSLNFMMLNNE
jgi:hypothetical protein